ncbi:hypothetical protein [Pseudomonas schmalbachii]|uniref:Uncharacterized protein n=1 Tax=Pseudomonas schmalbachii TaxID=2816993 RepID=A0ABS3TKC5_9PSED|nr:hypothetical protein [Pseudomonas schmalbachii]MBO3274087.1 hypothetical protein [Pseudomonas schmalbachii]
MSREENSKAKALAGELEMKLDTAVVLAEITLDNAAMDSSQDGPYLDNRRAGSLMQAQIYLSQSIFDDFCKLMDLLEVPHE